ncbi:hypothetical protein, partial [Azohydromonas aeria]|uniref:hypothetical protein n=1 Tax=Azohydromonas aeria TaxID=2590212 RepID=UPI0018DFED77
QNAWEQQVEAVRNERLGLEQRLLQVQGNTAELRRRELAALDPTNRALLQMIFTLEDAKQRAEERAGIEQELLQLQGNTAELRRRELAALDPANRALKQLVFNLQDAQAVAQEREGLEARLLQIQGNTAEIRRRELEALDPANRAIQKMIFALEDAAAVAQEREGLEQRLLQVQGNTAELRRRELAALNPTNRALLQKIFDLEDAQKAAEEAKRLRDAWKSIGDTIYQEILRIRNLDDAGGGKSFTELQAEFAIATAKARAGDQEAAKSLPDASKALLEAASKMAGSAEELAGIRGATAGSLEQTMKLLKALGVEIPGFAAGGSHAGGLRVVGEVGPELEATGAARYFSTEALQRLMSGGGAQEEVRLLRTEVQKLREDMRAGHAAIAGNTGRMASRLDDVTPDGDAISIREAA